jgi:hypothetical protein
MELYKSSIVPAVVTHKLGEESLAKEVDELLCLGSNMAVFKRFTSDCAINSSKVADLFERAYDSIPGRASFITRIKRCFTGGIPTSLLKEYHSEGMELSFAADDIEKRFILWGSLAELDEREYEYYNVLLKKLRFNTVLAGAVGSRQHILYLQKLEGIISVDKTLLTMKKVKELEGEYFKVSKLSLAHDAAKAASIFLSPD